LKLLLDEMLSAVIAEQLRVRGHDVVAINRHPQHEALSDSEVLDLARAEHRAIVTNNLVDFRVLHHEAITPGGPGHLGMVFMAGNHRRTNAGLGRIVAALEAKLEQFPGESDLANGETWL
jgi:predicted nuclease of predicted toxin-antitoxin system